MSFSAFDRYYIKLFEVNLDFLFFIEKVGMNDFWTISHACLICKIVEMKILDNKKWHLRLSIDFSFVKSFPPFHTWNVFNGQTTKG
jgi:hypothetical protein